MKPESSVSLRPAEPNDAQEIVRILARNGVGNHDPALFRETWESYPFASEFRDIPTGWVLETGDGVLVGNLNNVHLLYEMNGRRLRGVVAAGWAVDAAWRGKSLRLMTAFFKQKGIDVYLNVSASPATAQVLTGMKIPRIPIPGYGAPCFWAVRPRAFALAALSRRSLPGAKALAWPAGLILGVADIIRRSGRGRPSRPVRRLDRFDERLEPLLDRLGAASPRLRAVRTLEVLEWRFRTELREGRVAIVAAGHDGALTGYAVLLRRPRSEGDMEIYDIADLQAMDDDPSVIRDLLLESVHVARADGVDALKFLTGLPARRAPAEALRPWSYQLPFWQQYFQAGSPELFAELSTANAWDFSFFDTF